MGAAVVVTEGHPVNIFPKSSSASAGAFFPETYGEIIQNAPSSCPGSFFSPQPFVIADYFQNPAESLDLSFALGSKGAWPR